MIFCYADRIDAFLQEQEKNWLVNMCSEFGVNFPGLELGELQKRAWVDCFHHLQQELSKCAQSDGYIIFEYALPMKGGRRPDVLLLVENKLFILEFKMKDRYQRSDYDLLCGYYRDLCNYHHESAELEVIAGLILTQSNGKLTDIESNISILHNLH